MGIDLNGNTQTFGEGKNGSSLSVFIGIGVGLTLTGLCTFGVVAGAKRFKEAP